MKPEIAGALLFRLLGVVMLLLAVFSVLGDLTTHLYVANAVASHDTYYVVGSSIAQSLLLVTFGIVLVVFSKALGRLLSKGLPSA